MHYTLSEPDVDGYIVRSEAGAKGIYYQCNGVAGAHLEGVQPFM